MTTYETALDSIIQQMYRNDVSNEELSKMAYVNYNLICDYVDNRKIMPADVMFACLSALGIKFDFKVQEEINENRIL